VDVSAKPAPVLHRIYARVLDVVSAVALVLVVAAFVLYVTGLLPARVTPERAAESWHLSAAEMRARGGSVGRWQGMLPLSAGDAFSLATLALLASGSLLCLLRILPVLVRTRRRALAAVVAMEIAILVLAASGILTPA
jgi:hypothetical protein